MDSLDIDAVTPEWLNRHGITIPRARGVFESDTGWVRVDATGRISEAAEKDQTVLAWLVDKGMLSNADVDYGIAYITYRNANRQARRLTGYKSQLDIATPGGNSFLSCQQAAEVFDLVRGHLGKKLLVIVEYACDTVRGPHTPPNYHPPYREAFTALGRAFDQAVKQVRETV